MNINPSENAVKSTPYVNNAQAKPEKLEEVLENAARLVEKSDIAMLGTSDSYGFPNIKAMLKIEAEGIKTFWFSTNTSSKRVAQLKENPKACVYFYHESSFKGLMLVGHAELLTDLESKKRLWKDGCEIYYPQGIDDPEYTVIRFTSLWGNYYEGLQNISFEV